MIPMHEKHGLNAFKSLRSEETTSAKNDGPLTSPNSLDFFLTEYQAKANI